MASMRSAALTLAGVLAGMLVLGAAPALAQERGEGLPEQAADIVVTEVDETQATDVVIAPAPGEPVEEAPVAQSDEELPARPEPADVTDDEPVAPAPEEPVIAPAPGSGETIGIEDDGAALWPIAAAVGGGLLVLGAGAWLVGRNVGRHRRATA